jgi:hypothetical protein
MKFYTAKKDLEFRRVSYSKTSLQPAAWKDCPPRERLEWIEASKRVLADDEILKVLIDRASGL